MEDFRTKFIESWQSNNQYFEMLKLLASLSKLFSESATPYLDYRIAENLFCKYYSAINDARSCTAYDARLGKLGIGIKTFGIQNGTSVEKIAEFNRLKPELDKLNGKKLAIQLAEFRNDRIHVANNTYDIEKSIYHIVGRSNGVLKIFNTDYELIDINDIHEIRDRQTSISFISGNCFYNFNKSKSVLMKKFILPDQYKEIPIDILSDPLQLLSELLKSNHKSEIQELTTESTHTHIAGKDYVILPLYSTRNHTIVPEKSGLNQWNASGRKRDENEVYIPVPKTIWNKFPNFFPDKDSPFELILPNGKSLSAKICQANGKAIMSNPNSDLGEWILRKVLRKKPGELVTINDLAKYGIDSVRVEKKHKKNENDEEIYEISFTTSEYENYNDFINE